MKVYPIVPGVVMSARTHQLDDQKLSEIIHGSSITAVVNLWHTPDERLRKFHIVRWYAHESIPDGKLHDWVLEKANALAKDVAEEAERGGATLIHCWGGRNRSGLVCALAARLLQRCTGKEAYELVKKARKGALVNEHFRQYLEGLPCPS